MTLFVSSSNFARPIRFSIAACLFALCVGSSCTKSKTPAVKTPVQLLTETGAWKFSVAGIDTDGNGIPETPIPAGTLDSCALDNTITFKADKSGVIDEGISKCETADPQTTAFTWDLANNNTELTTSSEIFAGVNGSIKIVDLTADKFTFSKAITLAGIPLPLTVIVTLVH